jgi:hypothetical protein
VKVCECGCGQPAPIATHSNTKTGAVKGQPQHFLKGHSMRVNHWGKDSTAYGTIHGWLRRNYPKTGTCDECGEQRRTDYALIHGREHGRDRARYRELCRKCHVGYDGSAGGGIAWARGAVRKGTDGKFEKAV